MINCIIVEDEFPAREELKFFLKNNKNFHLEKEFDNPIEALKFIENEKVQVVFLDINMPGLDGMSLGRLIHKLSSETKLVFITAYKEHAAEAFEIKAFDYLLKPYSENRIREVLDNLVEKIKMPKKAEIIQKESKKIAVNLEDRIVVISTGDILYIEANEKESDIVLPGITYKSKLKISQLEEILSEKMFFRCHRSYMVNINHIIEVEPWFNGGFIIKVKKMEFNIPVSRNRVRELKEILNIR